MLRLFGAVLYENTQLTLERTLFLVALLACHNDWMTRDEVMLLLWDDTADEAIVRQRLRQLLYRAKQMPFGATIETTNSSLRFTGLSDVGQFRSAIQNRDWQTALALYRGELLHKAIFDQAELEEWFLLERATLSAQFRRAALEQAAVLPPAEAVLLLEQALVHEPLSEDLLRALLESAKTTPEIGQRAFERYQKILAQELQLPPPDDLRLLAESLFGTQVASAPRAKLPTIHTAFVGRQAELDLIRQRFAEPHCRLLSIVGVGGIGKTRLALEAAARMSNEFADGAVFIDLARLADADLVPNAILEAFDERPQQQPLERLQNLLAHKAVLIVLDNFEHVLTARNVVGSLIEQTTALQILITTRESLGLRSEHIFEITGMPAPDTLFPLETQDAAQLFTRVAQRSQTDFRLQTADIAAFTRIYQAVNGMPLGLELAASWIRTLSLEEIAKELEQSLDVLASDAPDMPTRHKSFAAVFHSSWTLLSATEQTVLAQLALFQGGFDKDMALRLTGSSLPVLLRLVNKSLVTRREQRFVIHEMIRQYSEKQLSNTDKHQAMQSLLAVALQLAELWFEFRDGDQAAQWSHRLELDHDNIRAGLTWALQHDIPIGTTIAGYLEHFWYIRGHHREGLQWSTKFTDLYTNTDQTRLRALWTKISMSKELGEYELSRETLSVYCQTTIAFGDRSRLGGAEKLFGFIAHEQGNLELAKTHLQTAIGLFAEFNNEYSVATCHNSLALIAIEQDQLELAKTHAEESLRLKRLVLDTQGISYAIATLGTIAGKQGDYALEKVLHEESLHLKRSLGDQQGIATSLLALGRNALGQKQFQEAILYSSQALEILARLERRYAMINVIHVFADIAYHLEQTEDALFFVAACVHQNYQIKRVPPKDWLTQQIQWRTSSVLTPAQQAQLEFDAEKLGLFEVVAAVLAWKDKVLYQPAVTLTVLKIA